MEKEWDMIEVLRHSRHDWLNKLQIIKGNLDLNRIDMAKAVIDKIVIEAQNETKLSNLQLPLFATLLLKANWENYYFQLEYEVLLQEPCPLKLADQELAEWTNAFFHRLNEAIGEYTDNTLVITIDPQKDGVRFFFEYNGIIKYRELLEQFLDGSGKGNLEIAIKEFSEHVLAIEVLMAAES